MASLSIQLGIVRELHMLAVHASADVACFQHVLKQITEFALALTGDRRQHMQPGPIGQSEKAGRYLIWRLGTDRFAALMAMLLTDG